MNTTIKDHIITEIKNGNVIPYLGPGVLTSVESVEDHSRIPADSESLILALNDGKPMSPRLMYEFPRAAMNIELKKGRKFIENFLNRVYQGTKWSRSQLHEWLMDLQPEYIVDINRDTQIQTLLIDQNIPHILIVGCARISGTDFRFNTYEYNGEKYLTKENLTNNDVLKPILFKPMGTPLPTPSYIASDADYVDYITELMGGFAIPSFLKSYRKNMKYLILGMRFTRDTERMVFSEIIYDAQDPAGWAFISEPTKKEERFCEIKNIEIVEEDWQSFMG